MVTLLILILLTIVGLSLTLTTQTEMLVGASEPAVQQVFYAADSGLSMATSKVLVENNHRPLTFEFSETRAGGAFRMKDEINVSVFLPLMDSPCNLCQINQGSNYAEVNHAVTTDATRSITSGGSDKIQARKTVSAMVEIQPMQPTVAGTAEAWDHKDTVKIRF